jgi:hypothetical protein
METTKRSSRGEGCPPMKNVLFVTSIIVALSLVAGCTKKTNESKEQSQQQNAAPGTGAAIAAAPNDVAGIHWTVPQTWTTQPKQQMRAATYGVPSPKEGVDAGDCGVFYFGKGQGGTVEENLNRWISQFEKGGKHEFSSKDVNNLKVTTIRVTGTYLAPSGPMMQSQDKKADYKLLGAIVEGPEGLVFFKFTGPAQTVDANAAAFNQLVESLSKD